MVFTQEKVQFQQIQVPTDVSFYLSKTSLRPVSAQSESFKINFTGKKPNCTWQNNPGKQTQKNLYFKIAAATEVI